MPLSTAELADLRGIRRYDPAPAPPVVDTAVLDG
jgi:hypothetical protein